MENRKLDLGSKQMLILAITTALMVFGFLAIAVNVRTIMAMEYPALAIVVAQVPAAIGGIWLGLELMWAGRKEGLNKD